MPLYLQYHGKQGQIIVTTGILNTDRYGLDTATASWKYPMDERGGNAPNLGDPHPIWPVLLMEKRQVDIQPGFTLITGEYAGVIGTKPHIFECQFGNSDEPIETHPKFVTDIAGRPSSPKNGAVFLDPKTRLPTKNDTPGKSEFAGFAPTIDGDINEFAGITSFFACQCTVRETWVSTDRVSGSGTGQISEPQIGIALPHGGNWLQCGASFQQRGGAYQNTLEWRASGPRGWNDTIYGG